jgi:hypothetical protein
LCLFSGRSRISHSVAEPGSSPAPPRQTSALVKRFHACVVLATSGLLRLIHREQLPGMTDDAVRQTFSIRAPAFSRSGAPCPHSSHGPIRRIGRASSRSKPSEEISAHGAGSPIGTARPGERLPKPIHFFRYHQPFAAWSIVCDRCAKLRRQA